MNQSPFRVFMALLSSGLLLLALGCSSSSTSPTSPSSPSGPAPTGPNVLALSVSTGPTEAAGDGPYTNGAFTSVTVCVPGSTTQCQTISGVLIDTGSSGLRILSSALTLSLPQQVDSNNNAIAECAPFASGVTWGPVQTADVSISEEAAASLPIQVIGAASPPMPVACADEGPSADSLDTLGANGILGIGVFPQDCGSGCAPSTTSNLDFYYTCPAAGCEVTTEALSAQVTNPIVLFTTDNNGSIVELASVPAATAEASLNGYLVFGIGTESNNGLGSATIYGVDSTYGNFTTIFDDTSFTDAGFVDLGSNALYFDPVSSGLAGTECEDAPFWYCPAANTAFTAENEGFTNGTSGTVSFTVADADAFIDNSEDANDAVINGLAGPFTGYFDWGMPFFFGLNVYTAIAGQSAAGAPYVAY
jgi:Protein of unknown function (DUF3443)